MVLFVIFQVGGSMFELEQVGLVFGTLRYTAFRAAGIRMVQSKSSTIPKISLDGARQLTSFTSSSNSDTLFSARRMAP